MAEAKSQKWYISILEEDETGLMFSWNILWSKLFQLSIGIRIRNDELEDKEEDNEETTALMMACAEGHKNVVQLLLDHSVNRIDVNARNDYGYTAFMYACAWEQIDVVEILLKYSEINFDTTGLDLSEKMKAMIQYLQCITLLDPN